MQMQYVINVDSKGFGEWMWMGTFLSPVLEQISIVHYHAILV
jgi:hypothetical protein